MHHSDLKASVSSLVDLVSVLGLASDHFGGHLKNNILLSEFRLEDLPLYTNLKTGGDLV